MGVVVTRLTSLDVPRVNPSKVAVPVIGPAAIVNVKFPAAAVATV